MGTGPISDACSDRTGLCEIQSEKTKSITVNGEDCPRTEHGYQCSSSFIPAKPDGTLVYLPGPQEGEISFTPRGEKLPFAARLFLPANSPGEVCDMQEAVIERAISTKWYFGRHLPFESMLEAGDFARAESIAAQLTRPANKYEFYLKLAKKTGLAQHYQIAQEAVESPRFYPTFDRDSPEATKLDHLLNIAEAKRDRDLIEEVIQRLAAIQPSSDQAFLIKKVGMTLARAGFKQDAVRWLESHKDSIPIMSQVSLLGAVGNIDDAVKATEGTAPDYQIFLLLKIVEEHNRPDLYRKMIKIAKGIPDLHLRETAYWDISSSIARRTKRYGYAKRVANKISRGSPLYAVALGHIGAYSGSLSTLRRALGAAKVSQEQDVMEDVAGSYADAGYFKKALQITDMLTEQKRKDRVLKRMLEGMVKKGMITLAMETADRILAKPDSRSYPFIRLELPSAFFEALAQAGEYEKAIRMAHRNEDFLGMLRIVKTMAKAGHFHRAIALADSPLDDLRAFYAADLMPLLGRVSKEEFRGYALAAVAAEMCKP